LSTGKMDYYFVKDYKKKYRFFSSQPIHEIQVNFTKLRQRWEEAKRRLMLLPQKILSQEQAFERAVRLKEFGIKIHYSGSKEKSRIKKKFIFFLLKQRSKHIFLLIIETLLLPISGLMAFLPGPNIFFYVLFLIMYTQWKALRGIKILINKDHEFIDSSLLGEWEAAVESGEPGQMKAAMEKINNELCIDKIQKILYK
jgi:hypothetical protein